MTVLGSLSLLVLALAMPPGDAVRGDYVEARTADVWTGPCFANGQVELQGRDAVLGWRVSDGSLDGIPLDGLVLVAVLRSDATLGDPHAAMRTTESLLLVDERADAAQRDALVKLARTLAGPTLGRVVDVRRERVALTRGGHGEARLVAGTSAEVRTRCLHSGDAHCGNEDVYYPPLTRVDADPALAVTHAWRGEGLGGTWSAPRARSAFVGTFELVAPR